MGISLQSLVVTTSQTITVPAGVSMYWAQVVGAGGGATGAAPSGGSQGFAGGGAGEICNRMNIPVTPGGSLAIVIGTGGTGQTNPNAPTGGGDTTVGGFVFKGSGHTPSWGNLGNPGGGPLAKINNHVSFGDAQGMGFPESPSHFAGTSTITAGGLGNQGFGNGGDIGGAGSGTAFGRSGGGAGAFWMKGGDGGGVGGNGQNASGFGAGGGGGGGSSTPGDTGGNGKDGAVILFWIG